MPSVSYRVRKIAGNPIVAIEVTAEWLEEEYALDPQRVAVYRPRGLPRPAHGGDNGEYWCPTVRIDTGRAELPGARRVYATRLARRWAASVLKAMIRELKRCRARQVGYDVGGRWEVTVRRIGDAERRRAKPEEPERDAYLEAIVSRTRNLELD